MLNKLSLAEIKLLPPVELVHYINQLINFDFDYLIYLLYRIDISETKLKKLLSEQPLTNAGLLIADLMIARWQQAEYDNGKLRFRLRLVTKNLGNTLEYTALFTFFCNLYLTLRTVFFAHLTSIIFKVFKYYPSVFTEINNTT